LPLALPGISELPDPKKCPVTAAVIAPCFDPSMNFDM
jgi:hypothetical protein